MLCGVCLFFGFGMLYMFFEYKVYILREGTVVLFCLEFDFFQQVAVDCNTYLFLQGFHLITSADIIR